METTTEFTSFELSPILIDSLQKSGFQKASAIQEMTITPILEGKDILALAETGSGKTGAFAIPIIEQILRDKENEGDYPIRYVVMSPTRELAQQTYKVFNQFGKELGIHTACVIGGESMDRQKDVIGKGVQVLVATPGRLKDLINQKIVKLDQCKGVVFDEADRLFDMGFKKDIEYILGKISDQRQLIMVSATTNMDVLNTAHKFRSHPLELKLNDDGNILVESIHHSLAMVSSDEKFPLLVNLLRKEEDHYAIVFCNTQYQTHLVAEWLKAMGFKAKPISGRLPQNKRTKLMQEFRDKEVTILVCTDVAARGLDIKDVSFVINYDLPQEAANYVHRIGRTGRAGKEGKAISLCAHEDCEYLDGIYAYIEQKIEKMPLSDGDFATDIVAKPRIDYKSLRLMDENFTRERNDRGKGREKRDGRRDDRKNGRADSKERRPRDRKPDPVIDNYVRPDRPAEEMGYQGPPVNRKVFEATAGSENEAISKAEGWFKVKDKEVFNVELLEKGKRKFIIFGPRNNKYKVTLKPIYKKLLEPFYNEMITWMGLDLEVRVSFKKPSLRVSFSGNDEGLMVKNENELLEAFEHLGKKFLSQTVRTHDGLKISVRCQNKSQNQENSLMKLVDKLAKQVVDTGKPVKMRKSLNPAERRLVHQHLETNKGVKTVSLGDGRLKKIEIQPV
ncbi:MAG: DEAD/DEAH box helicase [Deltaproteobacteria bacterium]|nr:MAG: DEAD/DEAH box helicase [Deltaproteobacteria bacterium]